MIKLFSPTISNKEIDASTRVLKSLNWASGAGNGKVLEFEEKIKKYLGSDECVAVDNGTAALQLALDSIDIRRKQVLVPSLTFVSTVHSVIHNGGIPIFVDVDLKTLCIDVIDLKKKITEKSKVIIPMHFGGLPCDMNSIETIAKRKKIHIVEDAAHAFGSQIFKKKIGSTSEMVCFSFHPVKNLAVPKGGLISINSKHAKKIKKELKSMRWCGIDNRKGSSYDVTNLGFNFYMDEISAAIGIEQLKKISILNKKRKNVAKRYHRELELEKKMPFDDNCSYHMYWILIKNRKKFINEMKLKGIETGTHYSPVHLMSYYKSNIKLPITEKVGKEIVTLPMHANLTKKDVDLIINTANSLI
jgi:perosamine synthetase